MDFSGNVSSKIKNILNRYALPLIYGFVVMKIIFAPYTEQTYYTLYVGFAVYECLLFFVFEKIKPKKFWRGLIYMGLCVLVFFVCRFILTNMEITTRYSFIEWFYLDISSVGEVMPYVLLLFFALGFFIVSIIYYFTIIRFRALGLLLVSIFPFSIYGKRSEYLSVFSITLMLTVFLALLVHSRQVSDDKREDNKGSLIINKAYIGTMLLFVTFVGALTMFVPKPEIQSQLEQNKDLFNFQVIKIEKTNYDNLNNTSSPRFGADATGQEIFRLWSQKPQDVFYLRRQSFDYFENNQWVDKKAFNVDNYAPDLTDEEYKYMSDPEYVRNLTFNLLSKDEFKEYADKAGFDPENAQSKTVKNIITETSDTFGPSYIPAPLNTSNDQINFIDDGRSTNYNQILPTYRGDIVSKGERHLLNVEINYTVENKALYETASQSQINWYDYYEFLSEASEKGYISENLRSGIMAQKVMYTYVDGCTEELKNLAHEITDKYDSDYAKAKALVDYFENNGYIYDLEYEPEDESIDYFLFTSKRGSCTSYATAMTLMARSVGLSAKYVEGFAVNEIDKETESYEGQNYIVRDSCAHAFVEVLIPGFGWMTFDPTVSGYLDNIRKADKGLNINGNAITSFLTYFSQIALFLGAVFVVVIFVLLDRIIEVVFRIRFKFASGRKKILLLYKRCLKLLEISSRTRLKGKTPDELAEFAFAERGADIKQITDIFSETVFGGAIYDENEIQRIYEIYKNNYPLISRKPKKEKAKA